MKHRLFILLAITLLVILGTPSAYAQSTKVSFVNFKTGIHYYTDESEFHHVHCVRGGQ